VFPEGADERGAPTGYALVAVQEFRAARDDDRRRRSCFPLPAHLGREGSSLWRAYEGRAPWFQRAGLLARPPKCSTKIPMEDRDTKGDLYEYMLGKIASAGQNGQFRTPRHIIR